MRKQATLYWRLLACVNSKLQLRSCTAITIDRRTRQIDFAAKIFYQTEYNPQAETGAFTGLLWGDKGLKDTVLNIIVDTAATVTDHNP